MAKYGVTIWLYDNMLPWRLGYGAMFIVLLCALGISSAQFSGVDPHPYRWQFARSDCKGFIYFRDSYECRDFPIYEN